MNDGEYNVTGAVARRVGLRLLLWIVLGAWFLAGALRNPNNTGSAPDWAYFTSHHVSAYKTWAEYGEFPEWDPFACGGIPAAANVQNDAASPSFLTTLLFGLWPGLKLGWLLLFVFGLEGTYRYARHKGAAGLGAVLAAAAFCFSGRFVYLFYDGQPAMLGFLLTPWVLLGFEKGMADYRWSAVGGLVLAWVFCEGGAIATPLTAVVLLFLLLYHTGARLLRPELRATWYKPLLSVLLLGTVAVGISAMRFLPLLETLLRHPRVWRNDESYGAEHILSMVFKRSTEGGYSGAGTSYVGILMLGLFAYALAFRDKAVAVLFFLSCIALTLAMGDHGPLGLYEAVRKLPLLRNLRSPFRYTYFLALFVAVGGGRGLTLVEHHLLKLGEAAKRARVLDRLRYARTACTVLFVAAAVSLTGWIAWRAFKDGPAFNRERLQGTFDRPAPRTVDRPFAQAMGNRWSADVWPSANLGLLMCFEEQPFPVSPALRGDLPQEEYLADPAAGTVRRASWSPHHIALDVDLQRPATILVNQNAHRGWSVLPGHIVDHQGLLAVAAPAGRYRMYFWFSDPLTELGFGISFVTASLLLVWFVRSWYARRRPAAPG